MTSNFRYLSLPSALDILNANISNVDISHVTLSPQTWKIEILKLWNFRFKIFAVYLCPLWTWRFECWHFPYYFVTSNLKPWNLETLKTFTSNFCCLFLFSELDISNVNISHVDIFHVTLSRSLLIIKNEMYGFKTRNVPFSCTKNVAISNTERWPFQHSHKKPKGSLEGSLNQAFIAAELAAFQFRTGSSVISLTFGLSSREEKSTSCKTFVWFSLSRRY